MFHVQENGWDSHATIDIATSPGGAALEKYNAATAGSEIQEGENRWANRSQMKLETVRAAKL